ncbi:MAG TPA: SxtJ family membrane protein [Pyrinomonadaceae bacterium]|nr:SxtJ family membrane protein [Pyrinomonadaceae bacterium]
MSPNQPTKRKTYRAEREFGLIVGGVFILLSLWWMYRGKFHAITPVTVPLGTVLVALGLVVPRALVIPNKAWMTMAEGLSFVTTRIILAFVFFVIVTPIGFFKRLTGWDPLNRRASAGDSYWRPYPERQKDPRHYEKMF